MPPTGHSQEVVPFEAGDGLPLNLIHVRGPKEPHRGPVLLVHGAGVRANIFRAPVARTLVDELIDRGWDVWLENWRASIDFPPTEWTLDQAALYDHPRAVDKVVERTGASEIQAVIHCQGSTSFSMSAVAGLVPKVSTIVSNAVSLHPVIPAWSSFKLAAFVPMLRLITRYLNPHWGVYAPDLAAKFVAMMVRLTHHECHNEVCKGVSFTYGSGFPALWSHENLNDPTHEWLKEEFAAVPLTFFRQIRRCVRKGHLVGVKKLAGLPKDFGTQPPQTDARFALFAGVDNRCFLPQSQVLTHEYFEKVRPGYHTLHLLKSYGHLDVFMGQNAARDTFPLIVAELERGRG